MHNRLDLGVFYFILQRSGIFNEKSYTKYLTKTVDLELVSNFQTLTAHLLVVSLTSVRLESGGSRLTLNIKVKHNFYK